MRHFLRYLSALIFISIALPVLAQTTKWRDMYQVKKKDSVFGIAKKYNLTLPELMDANPDMKKGGYELKKGDYVFIPFEKNYAKPIVATTSAKANDDIRARAIRVGVMLPLHDVDGDGKRMVEYYRGVIMACDSMKAKGVSTEVWAWNVNANADIRQTLLENNAKNCDIIFGPLYSTQVKPLGDFCNTNNIKLVIPFSVTGDEVVRNPQIFQIYQTGDQLNNSAISAFLNRFGKHHPVFIDCNDSTSKKGSFTFALRKELDRCGIRYNITNLKSSEEYFAKAFSKSQPNIVILNTGRSPELNVAIAKINGLTINYPGVVVSLFGYTEWLMYTKYNLENFFKYDTYIPSTFYYNPLSSATRNLENNYRRWFNTDMMSTMPRFAITGYDQAQFFINGLHRYGKSFNGTRAENIYTPLQTSLNFKRAGNGGMQNSNFILIHYTYDHNIESISY